MFQNKTLLSSITFASILSLYDMPSYACIESGPGKYCHWNSEHACEEECYCPTTSSNASISVDVRVACLNPGKDDDKLRKLGVKRCPYADGFPHSDKGAKSDDDCYAYDKDHKKAYYIKYSCPAGQYFPANSITCQPCKNGHKCPGVKDFFSKTKDRGIESCPSGTESTDDHTDCVSQRVSCSAGQYLPANSLSCKPCKTGYICPGKKYLFMGNEWNPKKTNGPLSLSFNRDSDSGIYLCPSGTAANSDHTNCVSNSQKSPNKQTTTCKPGKYLPANATSCKDCEDRYYCPGGTFTNTFFPQGLKQCAAGAKPDSARTHCVGDIVATCNAGQYLPANATSCSDCQDRYYCPGGSFAKLSFDQGLFRCATGYIPNANKSSCIDASDQSFYCEPGFFLPGKATECKRCSTTKNYCPGGDFLYAEFDQGIYNCPYISVANADRSSCVMTLTQDYMKYGPNGSTADISEQCWAKKTTDEYVNCIFSEKTQKIEPSLPSKKIMVAPVLKPQNLRSLPGDLMIEKPVNLRKEVNIIEKGAFDKVSIEAVKKI